MKSHKNHSWRRDCRYIQRARAAYGMKSEEEYKPYIKAKDKAFKSIWPNEDFGGYGSSGWKDNSGNRCRYQWEPKIKRNYEKIRRKKDVTIFSGRRRTCICTAVRTKEELDNELQMLREEFGC